MAVRSYFNRPQNVVELRETTASPQQPHLAFRSRSKSTALVSLVAPLLAPEVLSSGEEVRHEVEDVRSAYIKAVGTSLPPPITVSEVAEAQALITATSDTSSLDRLSAAHENDVPPIPRPSSALGGKDYLRPTTPTSSNRASLYPAGNFQNSSIPDINDMKGEIMCNYLHQQQLKKMWSNGGREEGVLLKKSREYYTCCPSDLQSQRNGLFDAVKRLNVRVCR